jgi:hypothetical protein
MPHPRQVAALDLERRGPRAIGQLERNLQLGVAVEALKSRKRVDEDGPVPTNLRLDRFQNQRRHPDPQHLRPLAQVGVAHQEMQPTPGAEDAPRAEEEIARLEKGTLLTAGEDPGHGTQKGRALRQTKKRAAVESHRAGATVDGACDQERRQQRAEAAEVEPVV